MREVQRECGGRLRAGGRQGEGRWSAGCVLRAESKSAGGGTLLGGGTVG